MVATRMSLLFQVTTNPTDPSTASQHTGGWSESLWYNGSSPLDPTTLSNLCTKRALLLPRAASIVGIRYALYEITGNKLKPGGTSAAKILKPGHPSLSVGLPQDSLEISGQSASTPNNNRFRLGCLPDEECSNGEYQPDSTYKASVTNYLNMILGTGPTSGGGPYSFVCRDLSTPAVRVLSVVPLGGAKQQLQVVTDASALTSVGNYLRFHRCYDQAGNPIKGSYVIDSISGGTNTYVLNGAPQQTVVKPSGLIRHDTLILVTYGSLNVSRAVVKKIGRPFQAYRGRASNKTPA